MAELIKLNAYPVKDVLSKLLTDKTTGKNIVFATDNYSAYGCREADPITVDALLGFASIDIQPRVLKDKAAQAERTRKKAEVFTPSWIVNKMNNFCDAEWFWYKNVFTCENGTSWRTNKKPARFPMGERWQDYVDSRRLEITCGEAPYIASRYDTTTGKIIDIERRIGILDRKLRIVGENTDNEQDWLKWAIRAVESVYGYEFQGDSLLIARINVLSTFCDYLEHKWQRKATYTELCNIANIVSWNLWQMDGLNGIAPYITERDEDYQLTLLVEPTEKEIIKCKIYDWRAKLAVPFEKLKERGKGMKFDYVIGNPPYQEEVKNKGDRPNPIYDRFMDAAYEIGEKVCLIHPARFLFNAGQTPKEWNRKMLRNTHFKVLYYEPDATLIFPNTDIKGGVAITYHDLQQEFGEIGVFTSYKELNSIINKITSSVDEKNRMNTIIASQGLYRFSELLFSEHPEVSKIAGTGTGNKIVSNIIEKLPDIFVEAPKSDVEYIRFLGRINKQRAYRYIARKYLEDNKYIDSYNLFIPEANNTGHFGETLTEPTIGYPNDGSSDTFLSAGIFATEKEPQNLTKYIKTKFFRALLGVKKVTQHCPPAVWTLIPLQDFTVNSDIDWSKSIHELDKQLYVKYGLSQEEINFIETHVKEME